MLPSAAAFDQAAAGNPEARKLDSYPLFDWLRFALASLVALGHEGLPALGPIDAGLAVDIFLALSGWLIGGILLATTRPEMPRFFFNRVTRIWIPYAAAAAAIYGLAALRDGIDADWWKYLFYDATFTHYTFTVFPRAATEMPLLGTGNHFWSLSIEEQFYLFAPLVMFLLPAGKKLGPWLVIAGVALAAGSRAAPIALGVAAAIVQREHGAWHLRGIARAAVPFAAAALLALAWLWDRPQSRALFAVALVLALARQGRRGQAGLLVGAVSYPLYLNHWMGAYVANAAAKHSALGGVAHMALAYAAAVVAGVAAWALIDRLVLARRVGWYSPAFGRACGVAAYGTLGVGLLGGAAIRLGGG